MLDMCVSPDIQISMYRRHLEFHSQQEAVEALAAVLSETSSDVTTKIQAVLAEAKKRRIECAPEKLARETFGDVTLITFYERERYLVLLANVDEVEGNLKVRNDLLEAVTAHNPAIEQAVIIGTAAISLKTREEAKVVLNTLFTTIPLIHTISVPDCLRDPDHNRNPENRYNILRFPIEEGKKPEEYACILFSGKERNIQNDDGTEQLKPDIILMSYQAKQGLTVQLSTLPPTEKGITLSVQIMKLGNPLIGQPYPMSKREAAFTQEHLDLLKQAFCQK